jgi:hypothetical protein
VNDEEQAMYEYSSILQALRDTSGRYPLPAIEDREAWQAVRGQALVEEVLRRANIALQFPPPQLLATSYLAYQRVGQREPNETPVDCRRARLALFTLAECLSAEGRYLDALLNEAWAICEESSWVVAAHGFDWIEGLPRAATPLIDLWSASTSFALAEVDYLLGERLHPALRQRIRDEVEQRSTRPFLERNDFPWLGYGAKKINNWMPVCAGGTAAAALYLEKDDERLAAVLHKALEGCERYLATFGADGGCAEGVGYWEKGIFALATFGELLAARTEGRLDLLADPRLPEIMRFPARVELSPRRFVAFSDTGIDRCPQAALLHFLARRYNLPELAALDYVGSNLRTLTERGPIEKIRDLLWYPLEEQPPVTKRPVAYTAAAIDCFPDLQWCIARAEPAHPEGLVLAFKGGHNGEPHNHNDVGSFMLHWRGESLLAELAAMRYTRDTFRAATRYTLLANRSLGHSVPFVNHCEQAVGAAYHADGMRYEVMPNAYRVRLDLAAAYPPEADLARLERQCTLHQNGAHSWVELSDVATFASKAGTMSSVFISFATATLYEPGRIVLNGAYGRLALAFDPDMVQPQIERISEVDLRGGPRDITRIWLKARVARSELTIRVRCLPIM